MNESKSWLSRLKEGLSKSTNKLTDGISGIFTKKKLDKNSLEELEELLISADLGITAAQSITRKLSAEKFDKEISVIGIKERLSELISEILVEVALPIQIIPDRKPQIILFCGVNGNGKTTTIGKLAAFYKQQGKKVMLAACDTFRAAAVEQLAVWADRAGCVLVKGEHNADPASVAFNAIRQAVTDDADILFIDTAGRLQNKANLMEELNKIIRVIKKIDESAPHNTILVLDATTGQNAHSQVETFQSIVNVNGLIVTKLDGTAKAGVVVALAQKFKLPIHAIGVGEKIDDLQPFDPKFFASNLVGIAN